MSIISTLYGEVDAQILNDCSQIRLLVLDVDGVLSDGFIYLGNNGEEYKAFNTKDGYGIKALRQIGIDVAVITGRRSTIVENRMRSLQINHIIQGVEDKKTALQDLMAEHKISKDSTASIGDDMPDLGLFELSNLKVAVKDAHPIIRKQANFITTLPGGKGAVREFCDLILQSRNALDKIVGAST
ncbi:MAG: 3-deoxy-manno-octulosonate-8-phosphatase KdsC [Pseudomonadota bacterium]